MFAPPSYTLALTPSRADDAPLWAYTPDPFDPAQFDRETQPIWAGDLDEELINERDLLRYFGLGSWLSGLPRRFPARIVFPTDALVG